MTNVIETVNSFLEKYDLKNKTLCLGFSGGYDSMCLLDVLYKLDLTVIACHLNHNWRGEESNREEENCREFCEQIGVEFYSAVLPDTVPHTETAAREARYDFFRRSMEKYSSKVFLTAHNADDNAETVLYRIIKGTGVDGLCAISQKRDCFFRPLLTVRRSDIEKYCFENGLNPNSDSSNLDISYKRNLIRHEIFPLLNKINPDAVSALNSLSELAEGDCSVLNLYNSCRSTSEFLNYPKTVQGRIIKNLLVSNNLDYDRERIELLADFVIQNSNSKSGKVCSVGENLHLYVNYKEFYIIRNEGNFLGELEVSSEGEYVFGNYLFSIEKAASLPVKFPEDKEFIAYVNLNNISFTLRTRRDGDIISPLGAGGTQKLKKYFNEKKIPSHLRDNIILLCCDNEVLWAAGYGISDKLKVVDNKFTHVLKLRKKDG